MQCRAVASLWRCCVQAALASCVACQCLYIAHPLVFMLIHCDGLLLLHDGEFVLNVVIVYFQGRFNLLLSYSIVFLNAFTVFCMKILLLTSAKQPSKPCRKTLSCASCLAISLLSTSTNMLFYMCFSASYIPLC